MCYVFPRPCRRWRRKLACSSSAPKRGRTPPPPCQPAAEQVAKKLRLGRTAARSSSRGARPRASDTTSCRVSACDDLRELRTAVKRSRARSCRDMVTLPPNETSHSYERDIHATSVVRNHNTVSARSKQLRDADHPLHHARPRTLLCRRWPLISRAWRRISSAIVCGESRRGSVPQASLV